MSILFLRTVQFLKLKKRCINSKFINHIRQTKDVTEIIGKIEATSKLGNKAIWGYNNAAGWNIKITGRIIYNKCSEKWAGIGVGNVAER